MVDSDEIALVGVWPTDGGQALDRRGRRRRDAGVRAASGRARARGGEALWPRARAHGRNPRQAGVDPRACGRTSRPMRSSARWRRSGARSPLRRRTSCPPTEALRAPGRDGDGPVDPAHRLERDVEEARRRDRPHPARREGGERSVHEDRRGGGCARGRLRGPRARLGPDLPGRRSRTCPSRSAARSATPSTLSRRSTSCAGPSGGGRLREGAVVVFAAEAQARLLGLGEVEARARAERALDGGEALERSA